MTTAHLSLNECHSLRRCIRRKRNRQPVGSAYSIALAYMLYQISERIRRLERGT